MRVVSVKFNEDLDEVEVVLRPCWLARLFGAEPCRVPLYWDEDDARWLSQTTGSPLYEISFGGLIKDALERPPLSAVAPLPVATALSKPARREPPATAWWSDGLTVHAVTWSSDEGHHTACGLDAEDVPLSAVSLRGKATCVSCLAAESED